MFTRNYAVFQLLASIALAGVLSANFAVAANDSEVRSVTVSYAGLDINSTAGAAQLYRRIAAAAAEVCGVAELSGTHIPSMRSRDCVAASIARAVAAVDRPALSAYHAQKVAAPAVLTVARSN